MKIQSKLAWACMLSIILAVATAMEGSPPGYGFTNNQNPVIIIGQSTLPSATHNSLNGPVALTFDRLGNLWVVDSENNRVVEYVPPFRSNMSASLVIGQQDFKTNASDVGPHRLNFPNAVLFDHEGNLWVADYWNNRLLEFQSPFTNGMNASKVIGQPDYSSKTWHYSTRRNMFAGPWGMAFDPSDNLWVADYENNRVLEFERPFTDNMNASLVIGEPDFTTGQCPWYDMGYHCEANRIGSAVLWEPVGVAFDELGDLWVAEQTGGRVLEFKPPFRNGMNASLAIESIYPSALTFDSAGNLWVAVQLYSTAGGVEGWGGRVFEFAPPFSDHMKATIEMGSEYSGDPATLLSPTLMQPVGMTLDSAGNLWVADFQGLRTLGASYGRVIGFDAQVHSVPTPVGQVYFVNHGGLLSPLSSIPVTLADGGRWAFPDGLFNFTIQGLPPGGSVMVTITFPDALPSGVKWLTREVGEWVQLPASQTSISGTNMTLTLTNASRDGVISEFGGPALVSTNTTTSQETTITTGSQPQNPSPLAVLGAATVVVAAAAMALYWRHSRKPK